MKKSVIRSIELQLVCLGLVCVLYSYPYVIFHEGIHYVDGLLDNRVDHVELHLFENPGIRVHGYDTNSWVRYYLKDEHDGPSFDNDWWSREERAIAGSTLIVLGIFIVIFIPYIRFRLRRWKEEDILPPEYYKKPTKQLKNNIKDKL